MKTPAPMTWPSFLSGFQHCSVIILLKHSSDPNSAQRTVWIADALQTFLFSWTTCLHRILLVLHGYCNSLKLPIYTVTCTFFFKLLLAFWECHWKLYVQLILYLQFLAYQFQLCRQVHNQHYHLHLYDQKLCRQTADQTWMWTHMLVLEHTLTASLVLTAYYSCTHLQAIHYRMNYLDGFFIFFFEYWSKVPACYKCLKVLKTNNIFAVLSQEHDWLWSSKLSHPASTKLFLPTFSIEKYTCLHEKKHSKTLKKANPYKDFIW